MADDCRLSQRVLSPLLAASVRLINEHQWREEDLERLPPEYRYEIIRGRLVVKPPDDEDHHDLRALARRTLYASKPDGWRVHWNIGLALDEHRLIPDLVVLRPETARAAEGYNPITPAVAVEVESPSTKAVDRVDKFDAYGSGGIQAYWRIERDGKINIYRLAGDSYGEPLTLGPGDTAELDYPYPVTVAVPAQ